GPLEARVRRHAPGAARPRAAQVARAEGGRDEARRQPPAAGRLHREDRRHARRHRPEDRDPGRQAPGAQPEPGPAGARVGTAAEAQVEMADLATPRTRMTRDTGAGSVSSGSPLAPPKASPCVLDRLGLARPRARGAARSAI